MKKTCKLLFLFVLAALILVGCSKAKDPKILMSGSWYTEGHKNPSFILYDDGTCEIDGEYGTGKWAIVNNDTLKLTNFYGETQTAKLVEVTEEKLVVSVDGESQTFTHESTKK